MGCGIEPSASSSSSSSGSSTVYPEWKLELALERLKQKVSHTRSLSELTKNVRSAIIERRQILDQSDKVNLQKSLDVMQQNTQVNNLQSMVERLEMISRQQGLRFHPGGTGYEWFISSDMFFLELLFDSHGVVQEVKIQHDGKTGQQNCPEIINTLQKHDFVDFANHLSGLVSIYSLNADKNIKSKVFIALQALEYDLSTMSSTYSGEINEGDLVVMKTLLGVVKPRTGGHPLKLVFFISPYEFLDTMHKCTLPNTTATILEHGLGTAATIAVQGSSAHKLQMSAIVSIVKSDGKATPRYGNLNATNSTALPACFTFSLKKPIPLVKSLAERIHTITGIESIDLTDTKPLLSLLTRHCSDGKLDCTNNHPLFVTLPDQQHCYFMTENLQLEATTANSISFTLASQLPQIVGLLRQQIAFNTLIGSCIRASSKKDQEASVFEISALSYQNITVSFEHPLEKSLVTMEFDLKKDICHPQCRLHAVSSSGLGGMEIIPSLEEHACRVIQKSMSIPVTLRAVIRRWRTLKPAMEPPNPTFHLELGSTSASSSKNDKNINSASSCRSESSSSSAQIHQHQQPPVIPAIVKAKLPTTTLASMNSSSLTISPIPATTNATTGQLDLINTYMNMNPLLKTLSQQFQPGNLHTSAAIQMLASQIQQQQQSSGGGKPSSLLELLGSSQSNAGRKRKRKSSNEIPILPAPTPPSSKLQGKSPKRRMSESSNSDSERQTPTPNRDLSMNELGLDSSKWNLDITAVPSIDSLMATKLLSSFGAAAASIKQEQDFDDFTQPARKGSSGSLQKRQRDHTPKRSMSLDSSNTASLLAQMQQQQHQQLVPPSLSITPVVSTNSGLSSTNSTVSSLLAAMKSGIEIIPLNSSQPISIPNSITVTPILNKQASVDKKPAFQKKISAEEFDSILLGSNAKKKVSSSPIKTEGQKRKLSLADELLIKKTSIGKLGNSSAQNSMKVGSTSSLLQQLKKPSSPVLMRSTSTPPSSTGSNKSATGLAKVGQGKPSVTTLKSATTTTTITTVTPLNKPKPKSKTSGASSLTTSTTSTAQNSKSSGNVQKSLPALRPIFDQQQQMTVVSSVVKSEPTTPTGHTAASGATKPSKGFTQTGTVAKKGGLLAGVIDKLKSQQSVESDSSSSGSSTGKKELSRLDCVKASTAITTEMQKVKAATPGSSSPAAPSSSIASPTTASTPANSGNGAGSEYMIKQSGSAGLKLTINKNTNSPSSATGKEKLMKSGIKRSLSSAPSAGKSSLSNVLAKIGSKKQKLEPGSSATSPGSSNGNNGNGQQKGNNNGRGSPKPKEQQIDLTKKLFQPGAVRSLESGGIFDAPKFDSNFQIPKKSKSSPMSNSPNPITAPTDVKETAEKVKEKEQKTPSPPTAMGGGSPVDQQQQRKDEQKNVTESSKMDMECPESPDPASSTPTLSMEETPRIPTTPVQTLMSSEPEIPVLENNTPTGSIISSETQNIVQETDTSTPPVLEMQQPMPIISSGKEETEKTESAAAEMPPPPLPSTTPPEQTPQQLPARNSPSPAPINSPVAVTSIVHIVHSPQPPKSPAPSSVFLKSPLFVAVSSPHSVPAASPYAIDDDLMDEALIGGNSSVTTQSPAPKSE